MTELNDKKIAFIICSNDEQYLEECKIYIGNLTVPEGFSIEIIPIIGAKSMCSGYNFGMRSSDARYKVYLHQDVFILNYNLISDFISVFEADEMIGMIGVVGGTDLPADGSCHMEWDTGSVIECDWHRVKYFKKHSNRIDYVWAVDGLMIITNRDLPWREDVFHGWHFYDISQGMEFLKAGYRVAVPYQESPWCFHDNGIINFESYDIDRKIFCDTYSDYFEFAETEEEKKKMEDYKRDITRIRSKIPEVRGLFDSGKYPEAVQHISEFSDYKYRNNELFSLLQIAVIMNEEWKAGKNCLGKAGRNTEDLIRECQKIRFMLIRLSFDFEPEKDPVQLVENGEISTEAINILIDLMIYDKEKVRGKLKGVL